MSTSNDLRLEDVSVSADKKRIAENLDITFEASTIYTIIGPSGTGKSTLLNVVAGLCPIDAGAMRYGEAVFDAGQHVIGLVPQNYGLLPWETAWKTVTSNVQIVNKRKLNQQDKAQVNDLFEKMKLTELKTHYPHAMSGGQKQRVSLARAFAVNGDFLLMDEPFSALDAFTRESIQGLFLDIWQEHPQTTLFITHEIEEALLLGHKVVIMGGQPGRIRKVLDNPIAGGNRPLEERRGDPAFYEGVSQLRAEIREAMQEMRS